jgi:AraC-like DNA-binding protein
LWAVLDDACLMVFRLFGVNARPHIPGIDPRDRPWIFHEPWLCRYIHTEEAFNPTGPAPNRPATGVRRHSCAIARQQAGLPARGRCLSGLAYRTIPLNLGKGFSGTLVLGPFMETKPSDQGFTSLCRRLGIPEWDHMRWAWNDSPVLPPAREREMAAFCRRLFRTIEDTFRPLSAGKTIEDISGVTVENIFPPVRLADDFPLRVYGVFVTYSADLKNHKPPLPNPLPICDLEYMDKGRCRFTAGGKSTILEQGQAMLFLPGSEPELSLVGGEACESISISFVANASILAELAGKPFSLDAFQHSLLSRLLQTASPGTDASHRNSEVKLLLILLLMSTRSSTDASLQALPAPRAYKRSRHEAAILEAKRVLDVSAERNVSLADLARHVSMKVPTLIRLFRLETGKSPIQYHLQLRIEKAQMLLRHSMLTVTEIAEKMGYHSVHHFSNSFRKHAGKSPTEYAHSLKSTLRQVEEARNMLWNERLPASVVAERLGFTSVFSFAQAFKRYTGTSPDEYVHAKMSGK